MTKFALAKEHLFHFQKEQFLELEALLNSSQVESLKNAVNQALIKKRSLNVDTFFSGYDLWREDEAVKKICLDKTFATVAAELTGTKLLRLGYDQFLQGGEKVRSSASIGEPQLQAYSSLLEKSLTLEEFSCILGISAGALICLESKRESKGDSVEPNPFFPSKAGNVVFFSSKKPIPFPDLAKLLGQSFLLIVYASKRSLYIMNEADPHVHAFKHLGYVFGDALNDVLHPIVYR